MSFPDKMDLENERVLKLIFPHGVPSNLRGNPELDNYLAKLGTCKVDQLKKEQTRLGDETKRILDQTQELAISNYKTFITTAENSRSIFNEFQKAEDQVDTLINKLPTFSGKCEQFLKDSAELTEQRRLNTTTLHKNAQLLEILELPQLMERCIREDRYEEALELASYVQRLGQHQGHLIPVVHSIVCSVEALWHTMLVQLVAQLRMDLQLPKCLQIVGYLRRMQAFSDNELKLKFLQARDAWLTTCLEAVPQTDVTIPTAQQHLTKTIEITRINLFNIITQYRAIFPDDESAKSVSLKPLQGVSCNGDRLFQAWLHNKINGFLLTLETDLERGVNSIETVLGQCMYFGLSFSRVGADFRGLIAPIFVRIVCNKFESTIAQVNANFEQELEKFTLINKVTLHSRKPLDTTAMPSSEQKTYAPPETLLDFYPLAALCNGYLNALNELRLCAPFAVATDVTNCLQQSLQFVAQRVLAFYRQEQQAFTGNERETFVKLCSCFSYDLVPFVQRCIHGVFPPQSLTVNLGISLLQLEQQQLTFLQQHQILEPLKHLLPTKVLIPLTSALSAEATSAPIATEG
ncbi:conserved oligomeric Golgi complex subunit 8 isoform X1 [Drosophila sulfurigaster albostrigata]|uniref:conserved oligomeric Golgi complex subunit 8 isoform X1 n=1 Tax=Drosophila sulfurigaster albostrigata TaxID=89887 RepID=UPI002D21A254|nr:conserved oligomeric Golgi complex subunit 8 isoform X1 [Drosophila sulfurigaster albostrigata]